MNKINVFCIGNTFKMKMVRVVDNVPFDNTPHNLIYISDNIGWCDNTE